MMDNEKKENGVLDDAAVEGVSGGVGEQPDGSVVLSCKGRNCPGTLVFAPGEMTTQCPVCGGVFRRMSSGMLVPVYDP